jgi:hypothetical protein|tara:strand:+ start:5796 stop:7262 length:1467 start_codon:yes stop_codon:yes gene_type:complete
MPLQIRRGTEAERQVLASPPQMGEMIWVTDDQKLYIGDGATLLKDLTPITGFNAEDAEDAIGDMLGTASTHAGISFNYNDSAGTLDATVSLDQLRQNVDMNSFDITGNGNVNITGNVTATRFTGDYQGSISADDSTIMLDAVNGSFNLNGTVGTDIIPNGNEVYDIGSASARFKDLYLSGSTINLGTSQISRNAAGGINIPANSTIDGGPIGGAGSGGSLNVDIVGDDSTVIVNSSNGNITAESVFGNVYGSVFADDSTQLVNAMDGTVNLNNGTVNFVDNILRVQLPETLIKIGDVADSAPSPTLQITNLDYSQPIEIVALGGTSITDTTKFTFSSRHNNIVTPTNPAAGEFIGSLSARAFETGANGYVGTSIFGFQIDPNETVASDTVKGKIVLSNNGGTGSTPDLKYFTFDAKGQVAINQQNAAATLDVNGFAKLAVLTAEPTSPAAGMIAIADGATWDPSGANPTKQQAVIYLGTAWVQIAIQA